MKGIGVSPGIAISKVYIYNKTDIEINNKKIKNFENEIKNLENSLKDSKNQLDAIIKNIRDDIGDTEAEIFEAQKMILSDIEYINQIKYLIENEHLNAAFAINKISNKYIDMLNDCDNEYIKQRITDIKDISQRIIGNLAEYNISNIDKLKEDVIIIANDLTPSELVLFEKDLIKGFVTEKGGSTSHSAILANTMGIPAIIGVDNISDLVNNEENIIINGKTGEIYLSPDDEVIREYKNKIEAQKKFNNMLKKYKGKKTISSDAYVIELFGNVNKTQEVEKLIENDGEGIGLFRSEFLFMDRNTPPDEEEQFNVYKSIVSNMKEKPVIIRTLDAGGDKNIPYLNIPDEMNPFLGNRAIRLCLKNIDIFKVQLRAILRASAFGNIKIMFPMISTLNELKEAKKLLKISAKELENSGMEFNKNIEIGMMVEIPAAAIMADVFARHVDFFSIGTNDLIQYTNAVDRLNNNISDLYDAYSPAVLRLIDNTIKCGHKNNIKIGICGETAGNLKLIPLFIAMGIDELSVSPNKILEIRCKINNINKGEIEDKVEKVLKCSSSDEVLRILNNL